MSSANEQISHGYGSDNAKSSSPMDLDEQTSPMSQLAESPSYGRMMSPDSPCTQVQNPRSSHEYPSPDYHLSYLAHAMSHERGPTSVPPNRVDHRPTDEAYAASSALNQSSPYSVRYHGGAADEGNPSSHSPKKIQDIREDIQEVFEDIQKGFEGLKKGFEDLRKVFERILQ